MRYRIFIIILIAFSTLSCSNKIIWINSELRSYKILVPENSLLCIEKSDSSFGSIKYENKEIFFSFGNYSPNVPIGHILRDDTILNQFFKVIEYNKENRVSMIMLSGLIDNDTLDNRVEGFTLSAKDLAFTDTNIIRRIFLSVTPTSSPPLAGVITCQLRTELKS